MTPNVRRMGEGGHPRWGEGLGCIGAGIALLLGTVPLQRVLAPKVGAYHPWWEVPCLVAGCVFLLAGILLFVVPTMRPRTELPQDQMSDHLKALRAVAQRFQNNVSRCTQVSYENQTEEAMFKQHVGGLATKVDDYQIALENLSIQTKSLTEFFRRSISVFSEDDGWNQRDLFRATNQYMRSASTEFHRHGAEPSSEYERIHYPNEGLFRLQWLIRDKPGHSFGHVVWASPMDNYEDRRNTLSMWLAHAIESLEYQRFKLALADVYQTQDTSFCALEPILARPGFPGICGRACRQPKDA